MALPAARPEWTSAGVLRPMPVIASLTKPVPPERWLVRARDWARQNNIGFSGDHPGYRAGGQIIGNSLQAARFPSIGFGIIRQPVDRNQLDR